MTDDPGVMGNLPRSRPGRRSSKRGGATGGSGSTPDTEVTASSAKPKPPGGTSAAGRTKAKKPAATRTAGKKTTAAGSRPASVAGARARVGQREAAPAEQPAARREQATHGSTDPVTGAVLLAGKVVEGGLKVAGGILKRLPRP